MTSGNHKATCTTVTGILKVEEIGKAFGIGKVNGLKINTNKNKTKSLQCTHKVMRLCEFFFFAAFHI